jgi:hypothetical protein
MIRNLLISGAMGVALIGAAFAGNNFIGTKSAENPAAKCVTSACCASCDTTGQGCGEHCREACMDCCGAACCGAEKATEAMKCDMPAAPAAKSCCPGEAQ